MKGQETSWMFFVLMGGVIVCTAVEVGPIHLMNKRLYISYKLGPSPENTTLVCPVDFGDTARMNVTKMTWVLTEGDQEVGTYEWQPGGGAQGTGRLDGAVNLRRNDWELELTHLYYNLNGFYSCEASFEDGTSLRSRTWQLLIVDTTSSHTYTWAYGNSSNCTYDSSYRAYAVFPEPTVRAGMYDKSQGGYYDEVTESQWLKVIYANKSVAYSYENLHFKIDENTPENATFRTSVGITFADGTYVMLTSTESSGYIFLEQGCPEITPGQHQMIKYQKLKKTCRKQYKPNFFDDGKATVTCEAGYMEEDGAVETPVYECHMENLTWTPEPNLQDFQQFKCVIDPDTGDGDDDGDGGSTTCLNSIALLLTAVLISQILQ